MAGEREPSTRILLVRHGQTEWNAIGRWQGQADVPLDEDGLRQAAAASEVLGVFDAIWSSDLQRAFLTASIIAELSGVGPVQTDVRLRENHVGPWEGLNRDEVESGWPGFLAAQRRPDGFEEYDRAAERLLAAIRDIAAQHPGGEVLVVSHGGVIRAARRSIGAVDQHMANLDGCWFEVRPGRSGTVAEVVVGDVLRLLEHVAPASEVL